ncbi:Hypothetical protein AA314_03733 [Archangium gephyra]|uniref:Uncharacterized protein n=1 Tax=Archangium gephyra TaxID=48 RepID=A0AAC8Q701_9BACT|nr:Hypothetical protein AA314_03733 [Archangium gephyra]
MPIIGIIPPIIGMGMGIMPPIIGFMPIIGIWFMPIMPPIIGFMPIIGIWFMPIMGFIPDCIGIGIWEAGVMVRPRAGVTGSTASGPGN